MFTDPFGLCDPKKDKDCVLVAQATAGVTAGTKASLKLGAGGGVRWQAGVTAEAGTRQSVDLNERKVENERVGVVKVGASVKFTAFGGSLGVRVGYDSENPGSLIDFKLNPNEDGAYEVSGMVPVLGIVGPSGSYKINPAGASISLDPSLERP